MADLQNSPFMKSAATPEERAAAEARAKDVLDFQCRWVHVRWGAWQGGEWGVLG